MSENVNVLDLLANASESGFEELTLVEPFKYKLELDANKTKKDAVFVKGRVLEGPYAGKLISCGSLTFSQKAVGIALQNLKGMGISKDDLNAIAAVNPGSLSHLAERVAEWVKGRVVEASIEYNDYNNEMRNQIEIGKVTLISAPPNPGFGAGVPQAAPAPAAQAVAPAPTPEITNNAAPVQNNALPAPAPTPVETAPQTPAPQPVATPEPQPVGAAPSDDPGF